MISRTFAACFMMYLKLVCFITSYIFRYSFCFTCRQKQEETFFMKMTPIHSPYSIRLHGPRVCEKTDNLMVSSDRQLYLESALTTQPQVPQNALSHSICSDGLDSLSLKSLSLIFIQKNPLVQDTNIIKKPMIRSLQSSFKELMSSFSYCRS